MRFFFLRAVFVFGFTAFATSTGVAALPPEVKKELAELSRELRPVTAMLRKREVKEATGIIQKIEARLKELAITDDERDRSYTALMMALLRAKEAIPISFEKEVAVVLKDKCLRCHGETQASANLRLDTYANMGKGGRNGRLLQPGNPQQSLIIARVTANDAQARMPRGAEKLSDAEIRVLASWIAGGALFDGKDVTAKIGDSLVEKKPPVKVVMADGTETVSFKNDVAPWMVGVCLGCHSGENPRGGYSMVTFERLLTDGKTGSTIVPGDPDSSYVVDLVLRQTPIKMPAGNQTEIKKSQALILEKWIREGAHFDGGDPKLPLRSLVPTLEEREAAKLAAMNDQEFGERRKEQALSIWKRVAAREEARSSTTDNLHVYGSVTQERLDEIGKWGEAQVASLTSKYKLPAGDKAWRGRLIVFVTATRFDYEEFNTVLMNRRTPADVSGHAVVNANFETAYVAMHDVGDTDSADALNSQHLLNSLLGQAYLIRSGGTMPDWLRHGFGLLECGLAPDSVFLKSVPQRAGKAVSTIGNPARLFDDGTLAPEEVGPVGMLLTRFLMTRGGLPGLQRLVGEIQTGANIASAVQNVYGQTPAVLGQTFIQSGGK